MTTAASKPTALPMAREWTPSQRQGITRVDQSVLVSAAAGSGKTAVLAERCAYIVCDAKPRCGIDELLVVTFTESAANEMKWRIQQALRERLAGAGSGDRTRLTRQIALAEHAQVGTLHGFCARLLRQYFTDAGVDPTFRILDAEESRLLRGRAFEALWSRRFADGIDTPFTRLVDAYGASDADNLRPIVERIHELRCSVSDPHQWSHDALARLDEGARLPLKKSWLGQEMTRQIAGGLRRLSDQCAAAIGNSAVRSIAKYHEHLLELSAMVGDRIRLAEAGDFATLASRMGEPLPRTPMVSNDTPNKELAKSFIDAVKDAMKAGPAKVFFAHPEEFWTGGMKHTLDDARALLALADEFDDEFQRVKTDQRALDFADLERHALRLLTGPSRVARMCHQQFRHVLVDEYQDINDMQESILRLLSSECLSETPRPGNLFCVGDVKQSIFRFRQADSSLFLARQKAFRANTPETRLGSTIDLRENFRSRGPLLEAINGFFERVMTEAAAEIEYDEKHRLVPGAKFAADMPNAFAGHPIELHVLTADSAAAGGSGDETDRESTGGPGETDRPEGDSAADLERIEIEGRFVAHKIAELMGRTGKPRRMAFDSAAGAESPYRPLAFGDIAILLRSASQKADRLANVLRSFGIPVQTDSSGGFLDSREIRDLLGLLALIDNAAQDIPLAAYLRGPIVGLPDPHEAMAQIRIRFPRDAQALPLPFHEAARRYAAEVDDELALRLRSVFAQLDEWRHESRIRPVAELIWDILDRTGYLAFCQGLTDGAQRAANLTGLHDLAVKFAELSRPGLAAFLEFVQSVRDESDFQRPSVAAEAGGDGAADAVRIMTIHKSKGLEFPVVILPDLGKKFNTRDIAQPILMDREAVLGLQVVDINRRIRYPSLPWLLLGEKLRASTAAEEMRLLYVAMTRAREHLILLGTTPATKPDMWDSRWSGHAGPLPVEAIQGVKAMLDWIGPAASASGQDNLFHREIHASAQANSWPTGRPSAPADKSRLDLVADLKPLPEAPSKESEAAAESILRRLEALYPFESATKRPAAMAVTNAVKSAAALGAHNPNTRDVSEAGFITTGIAEIETSVVLPSPVPAFSGALDGDLPLPAFARGVKNLAGTDIGTATHLVLEWLDVKRPCRGDDLERQIARLVESGRLPADHAAGVDRAGIEWFMDSPAGQVVRSAKQLLREVPFCLIPEDGPSTEKSSPASSDRTVLRGGIDLLAIDAQDRATIIDYKTDRVSGDELEQRVAVYRKQILLYSQAVRRLTGRAVVACWLAFLTARKLRDVGT